MKYARIKGTNDIYGDEISYWYTIEESAKKVAKLYGYGEIRTPIIEPTELFIRSVGEETDIVQKEMYTFEDKGGRSITLRPEGTAPVVRAFIENSFVNKGFPQRYFYIGPMFRYERPQKGRQRQFHQVGFELFGSESPLADAEIIHLAVKLIKEIGLSKFKVVINSIGCEKCRPKYRDALKQYYAKHIDEVCDDCKRRYDTNILRLLDCKVDMEIANKAPKSTDYLCGECKEHYENLKKHLKMLDVEFEEDHKLVRGLDYYNRTVFEIRHELLGAQSAIAGGGRYDKLIEMMGGQSVPALGFAMGMERLIIAMKAEGVKIEPALVNHVYIAHVGDVVETALKIAEDLRRQNITVVMDVMDRGLRAQLKHADRIGALLTVIVGENELAEDIVIVKDMESGEDSRVDINFVVDFVLDKLNEIL
ncbi:MAG: histidine--tRNA ligase [Thermotogaceae bacterium]|nr:histidine--tRNA ligase [Thermotogaceae bacterium]